MTKLTLVLATCAALLRGTPEEGSAWLAKVESHLYRWPRPGSVVRFQVRTDLLDVAVAALKEQRKGKPGSADAADAANAELTRTIEALRKVEIKGSIDTETGAVTTRVDVPLDVTDPAIDAAVEKLKSRLVTLVSGAFGGLPLHDPSLLGPGATVLGAEVVGDDVAISIKPSRADEANTIHLNRRSELPETIETPKATMSFRFTEILPGRFVPASLEVRTKGGPTNRARYSWQKAGGLVFPSSIQVESGSQKATLAFESVSLQARSR
jgi:hypothetical protein